jgi:hypothetical protein
VRASGGETGETDDHDQTAPETHARGTLQPFSNEMAGAS